MIANLAAQRLELLKDAADERLARAVAVGTIVGLVVKYGLDKRYIFVDRDVGFETHGRKFAL
jgi:hypothetical protein